MVERNPTTCVGGERVAEPPSELAIGVDLGGTKIEVALVDRRGRVLRRTVAPTEAAQGATRVLQRTADLIEALATGEAATLPVGVGVAGQVEPDSGVLLFGPNLGWRDEPLAAALKAATGRPVTVLNDVKAATVAEWQVGAGAGCDDLFCLFIGTGIGGGAVVGGRLMQGSGGTAGEVGHLTVDRHGPLCGCGNYGCLEALASGSAITRRAREAVRDGGSWCEPLLTLAGGDPEAVEAQHVFAAATSGDPLARALLDDALDALAAGVGSILNAFNPALFILGGGVVEREAALLPALTRRLGRQALLAARRRVRFTRAELGNDAGVVGAALYAQALQADTASL
jgi:glucokinase